MTPGSLLKFESLCIPCDLWVLPLPHQNKWFSRVDWYLNWQLCKGLSHEVFKPSIELFRILEENAMSFEDLAPAEKVPLLVFSQGRVPASRCLVLESTPSLSEWILSICRIATQLQVQSVRVFLPRTAARQEAEALWRQQDIRSLNIEFTCEKETL